MWRVKKKEEQEGGQKGGERKDETENRQLALLHRTLLIAA